MSGPRVVPVPTDGAALDAAQGSVTVEAEGVQLVVRPSAWRGDPSYLPGYVTPLHLLLVNGSPLRLQYDYADLRLFDEQRFQYTALPPVEVGRLLRSGGSGAADVVVATTSASIPHRRRPVFRGPFWDPWWGPGWWGWPYYPAYAWPPSVEDVLTRALPVGTLEAGARTEGFVYFPRLRPEARRLSFEMHYRLAGAARVFTLPFAVERAARGDEPAVIATTPR